jgi:hypothetical protein
LIFRRNSHFPYENLRHAALRILMVCFKNECHYCFFQGQRQGASLSLFWTGMLFRANSDDFCEVFWEPKYRHWSRGIALLTILVVPSYAWGISFLEKHSSLICVKGLFHRPGVIIHNDARVKHREEVAWDGQHIEP